MDEDERKTTALIGVGVLIVVMLVCVGFWAWPQYRIYSNTQRGVASLREAEFTRQISELDATAAINKAKGDAQAEIERARGAAEANKILADSLEGKSDYLRYLYIQALSNGQNREIIYVPTNGLLPITEAGRAVSPELEK